ncbi:MAG TPA: GNAT family N-acetyltransferase [Nonomuraea sp.]|nr:GNAT family N-acetyltransferase [Nonomuraea sp.]
MTVPGGCEIGVRAETGCEGGVRAGTGGGGGVRRGSGGAFGPLEAGGGCGVRLREWRDADAPFVLAAFQVPDLRREAVFPVVTLSDALGWIASWEGAGHAFAVTVGADGQVVGNVAVSRGGARGSGWVSYWVVPEARGWGIAAAATERVARWAFEEGGFVRLELEHRTDNVASCRVATRAGFLPVGMEKRGDSGHEVERHARRPPG